MSDVHTNEIVRVASEWLDANKSRAYPFDESCADSPNRIPSEVFTDAFFAVSGVGYESLYVNKIVQGPTSFQVYVRTESKEIGLLSDILYTTPERTQLSVDIDTGDGITLSGLLVVGNVTAIKSMSPITDMDISAGRFFNGCVRDFTTGGVQGVKVGDKIYRGIVNLVSGEGITLSTETNPTNGETKIVIEAESRKVPDDNLIIRDDITLLKELWNLSGPLVHTINGVTPTADGDIILAYPSADGAKGFSPFGTDAGTIILQDYSGESGSCEDDLVESIMSNISELNDRSARIAETVTAIDTANNVMSVSLSRIS